MQKERPLSPHLQVYRFQLTMLLSITHRGTGVFLALSTPLLVCWLMSIAAGPTAYAEIQACFNHWFIKLVLLGWTFALFYHLCNGIRHLFWDVGRGYEISDLYKSGWIVVISASILTVITYAMALSNGGA